MADQKISQLTSYTPPIDTDVMPIVDVTTTTTKKITWANIKATLKTYFDTLYPSGSGTSTGTNTGDQTNISGTATNLSGTPALPNGTTATTQSANDNSTKLATTAYADAIKSGLNAPDGFLINGKIVPIVASNNLIITIKGMDGNDPSSTNPVYVRINNVIRSITTALSVTNNAGTNWCNAGSAELATNEIDYFVYLGYNTTDGVVIGFSRIPYANLYSDFSATNTNEKYAAISTITNATAGDNYVNIGRFAATLSAGAGYTWTVPTYTSNNLIQRPVYETRLLIYAPVWTGFSSPPTTGNYQYQILNTNIQVGISIYDASYGTSNATNFTFTLPFTKSFSQGRQEILFKFMDNGTVSTTPGMAEFDPGNSTLTLFTNWYGTGWTASGKKMCQGITNIYKIQ